MIYPTMVLIFATLVLIGMLMFLVPIFVKIFAQLGGQLPTLTQYVVTASNILRTDWYIIFPLFGLRSSASRSARRREAGRQKWDQHQAQDPDEDRRRRAEGDDGALLAHALDARLGRRRHHQGARDHGSDRRQLGDRGSAPRRPRRRFTRAFRSPSRSIDNPIFPPMVSQMVKIGEETGELEKMLGKIADFYEDEVDAAIQSLTSIIEPLMMIRSA